MRKRLVGITSLCVLAILLGWFHSADPQQVANVPRIGILANFPAPQIDALEQGLRDAGYAEGHSIIIERRYAEGKLDRFTELA